ncbi:MAG: DNA-3-methyladenine glycosylase family protein [Candidatus Micrarchaeia archaeon]|jgi:N-glycosylase/DNA lyase
MACLSAPDFNLRKTLECGQCFNWREHSSKENCFYSVIYGKPVKARQHGTKLFLGGLTAKQATHYFALDHPLKKIVGAIECDEKMRAAVKHSEGIRILRQDPWECAVSFIASQNSNIPRITSTLEKIREKYGDAVSRDGVTCFAFPTPRQLSRAPQAALKKLGLGYRARFVKKFAEYVARHDEYFLELKKLCYEEARDELMKHLGVGRKVADCICLYSLGKLEAFPVDRWIKRKMLELYGAEIKAFAGKRKANEKEIGDFARAKFGGFAGYAQQYLFFWAKENG